MEKLGTRVTCKMALRFEKCIDSIIYSGVLKKSFFLNVYLFLRKRERESASGGGTEREETQNRK